MGGDLEGQPSGTGALASGAVFTLADAALWPSTSRGKKTPIRRPGYDAMAVNRVGMGIRPAFIGICGTLSCELVRRPKLSAHVVMHSLPPPARRTGSS